MDTLLLKLIIHPLIIFLSDALFPQVYYPYIYQPILIGLSLAIVTYIIERIFLEKGALWIGTFIDFFVSLIFIYLSRILLPGVTITLSGILITSFLLSAIEYFQHVWLIKTDRV